jgi:hypothetical protein
MQTTPPDTPATPKLLDQVRDRIRVKHYSIRTEQEYVKWIKRFGILSTSSAFPPLKIQSPFGIQRQPVADPPIV